MPFLWRSNIKEQLNTSKKKPSPKHGRENSAQSSKFYPIKRFQNPIQISNAIKGESLFISGRKVVGSMTVEAALILPLFLFFFLNLGCAIELIRLHCNLQLALFDVGRRVCVYGPVLSAVGQEEEPGSPPAWWSEWKDITLSYAYIKKEITEFVGMEYLEASPLANGMDGLQFLETEIFDASDCVDIVVTYKVSPFAGAVGFRPFRMSNRYCAHLWNGYCIPGSEAEEEEQDFVYVAENGEVYHEDRNCGHLFLHIQEVSLGEAYIRRNANGEKYEMCEKCAGQGLNEHLYERVYITEDGTAIHYNKMCPGLKRTVHTIPRKETGKYRPCKDCAV